MTLLWIIAIVLAVSALLGVLKVGRELSTMLREAREAEPNWLDEGGRRP